MSVIGNVEKGDHISIESEPFAGPLWEVVETEVVDIGLVEIPLTAVVSDSEVWTILGGADNEEALSISNLNRDVETRIPTDALELQS